MSGGLRAFCVYLRYMVHRISLGGGFSIRPAAGERPVVYGKQQADDQVVLVYGG
jgi:hypothetical protein